jgi:hypothetical protein
MRAPLRQEGLPMLAGYGSITLEQQAIILWTLDMLPPLAKVGLIDIADPTREGAVERLSHCDGVVKSLPF